MHTLSPARVAHGIVLALLTAAVGCSDATAPAADVVEQVLFVGASPSQFGETRDVFRLDADGTGLVNLTQKPGWYGELAVSPDGRTVVFDASFPEPGCTHVWSMGIDGSGLTDLTPGGCGRSPRLSPDGRRVAYEWEQRVFVVGVNGTGRVEVSTAMPPVVSTCTSDRPTATVTPLGWLSDSRLLVNRFVCQGGSVDFAVNADGTGLAELDFWAQTAYASPDGSRIVFDQVWPGEPRSMRLMQVDGSGVRALSTDGSLPSRAGSDRSPWSPDGTRIAFSTNLGYRVVGVDDAVVTPLSSYPAIFHGWSSRGDRIMVTRQYDNGGVGAITADIFLLHADGSGEVNLTNRPGTYSNAVWIPRR